MKLSEMVTRLMPACPHLDEAYVTRLVRSWSSARLIDLAEDLRDGPRRHRRYEDRHLYRAAVLVELSRYGMPQEILRHAAAWLADSEIAYSGRHGCDVFEDARSNIPIIVAFEFLGARGGGQQGFLTLTRTKEENVILHNSTSYLVIDLNLLLFRLGKATQSSE